MSDFCKHENKHPVWTTVAADGEPLQGARQLRHQCTDCGKLLANHLPHRLATSNTPTVDLAALDRWNDEQRDFWKNQAAVYQERRDAERREWLKAHSQYLATPEWWDKREAVLEREGKLCQGCRAAPAVHVHHLTYDHWRAELLWELVAVCLDCHERAHRRRLDP
jgi:hypothetical protein